MDIEGFARWLDAYGRLWETGDKSTADKLYSQDVKYFETPFSEPMTGLPDLDAYMAEAAATQRDIHFWHQPYAIVDDIGFARWGATFVRVPSGVEVKLDGFFMIRFDESGRCRKLREWWHREES